MFIKYTHGKLKDLVDSLCSKITTSEFNNNTKSLEEISKLVDKFEKEKVGYALFSVAIKSKRELILIIKHSSLWNENVSAYTSYKRDEKLSIEHPYEFNIHEEKYGVDLMKQIRENGETLEKVGLNEISVLDFMITPTLTGYAISQKEFEKQIEECQYIKTKVSCKLNSKEFEQLEHSALVKDLISFIKNVAEEEEIEVRKKLGKFIELQKCDNIKYSFQPNDLNKEEIYIGIITKVITYDNIRYAILRNFVKSGDNVEIQDAAMNRTPTSSSIIDSIKTETEGYFIGRNRGLTPEFFSGGLPYNFIDKNRIIVVVGEYYSTTALISLDEKIDKNYIIKLKELIRNKIRNRIENYVNLKAQISDKNYNVTLDGYQKDGNSLSCIYKDLKTMIDEYKYINKRQGIKGENVKITDEITYNAKNSKITYKDFSISTTSDIIKSHLQDICKSKAIEFYRKSTTEENIIKEIITTFLSAIRNVINGHAPELKFDVILNDKVALKIEKRSNLIYINQVRFNRVEVPAMIDEMICYRNQQTADSFLKTIGRLGLSVYIGITSGYHKDSRIYRFKKTGRSQYVLIIDNIEINLEGKKILNELYNKSYYVDELVFKSCKTTNDYIKYKFLIDESYNSFLARSKEFLDEKIKETNSKKVYYKDNTRGKIFDGILIEGLSKKKYCIAYDAKESYVFMEPELIKDSDNYEKGKYICMIDQSSVKSTIGYDTVISKLLSLKNDSVVATKIYNLESELGKDDE